MRKEILLLLSVLCYSCDPLDCSLQISNNSSNDLYYSIESDSSIINLYTNNISHVNLTYVNELILVPKNTKKSYCIHGKAVWEHFFQYETKNNKMNIFVFSEDTLKKYSWNKVVYGNKYLYSLHYTKQELDSMNMILEIAKN